MSEQDLHHLIASFHLLTLINIQIEEGSRVKTHLLHLSCLNDPWVSSLKLFQQECFKINSFKEMFKTISGFEKKKVFLNNQMFLLLYRVQGWGGSLNALYILAFLWLYKTLNKCPYEGLVPSHQFIQFGWLRCSFVEIRCLRLANKDAFVTDLKANQKYTPRFSI